MAKPQEIRDMADEVLVEHVRTARQEVFGLRFQHATGELENTARLRGARRALGRALTIARERNIDIERELGR